MSHGHYFVKHHSKNVVLGQRSGIQFTYDPLRYCQNTILFQRLRDAYRFDV